MKASEIFTDEVAPFAAELIENGFTVYAPTEPRMRIDGTPVRVSWFHFSRVIGIAECFGTVGYDRIDGYAVTMPIKPSREFGSGVLVTAKSGSVTIADAKLAASTSGHSYWESRRHSNATPWGIGKHYAPVESA